MQIFVNSVERLNSPVYSVCGGAALWRPRFACLVRISVYEHVCRRRTSLNLPLADSLVLNVCVGALGINFCGVVTVFIDVLARFPCWLVQQWRPPCWQGLSARPAMRDDSSYSRDQLVNLRQYAPRLDDVTRRRAQAAGPGRERSRVRGCRAGKRKQTVRERSLLRA